MATNRTPYTDTTIQRRVVSDMIRMIDRTQVPLLQELGWENESGKFKDLMTNWPPGNNGKIEWLMDTMPPRTDALDGAINASQVTLVVDNGDYFHRGHVILIDSEYLSVSDRSNNTLTVVRAQGGTTAATHADNATITIVTIAKVTGDDSQGGFTTVTTSGYNYLQILEESVIVHGDQENVTDYGVEDTMAYHLAKLIGGGDGIGPKGKAGHLSILLANMAYKGKRQAGTNSVPAMAGGLDVFITTGLRGDTSTALSRTSIETELARIFDAGTALPDLIVTSSWGARKITQMFEGLIETDRTETTGGSKIQRLVNVVVPEVKILVDPFCANTKTYILDSSRVGWVCKRPFDIKEVPSLGDYTKKSVLGEYSFVLTNEAAHSIITHSSTL